MLSSSKKLIVPGLISVLQLYLARKYSASVPPAVK